MSQAMLEGDDSTEQVGVLKMLGGIALAGVLFTTAISLLIGVVGLFMLTPVLVGEYFGATVFTALFAVVWWTGGLVVYLDFENTQPTQMVR